ncbi:HAD-superfamily class IIA hydrolase, TIGR01459 [Salinihabitans flavidus]|uniref:HAD-superfamily class IIA hydrolase, TIGR01459 n=1 Tax=Salinihabitans flavidus TaxID=569882 RepID=A0A1H8U2S0_9RHOB|nr:HAD hydrolase-like protein [Salinihabitans flavidus]SEO97562.1 HAD-superfamily class IIA hydrolase, TIGR01459 [Salinihabitans flavidus]
MNAAEIFARYEAIRPRLPVAGPGGEARLARNLDAITDAYDVFVFDAYGVLNTGTRPIPGARERIAALRAADKTVFVLTNAAGHDAIGTQRKFRALGFDFSPAEILSSRAVCETQLARISPDPWGVMTQPCAHPGALLVPVLALGDTLENYETAAAFLLLASGDWTPDRQARLIAALRADPRPVVVANPDLVAPRQTGPSLEPGFYAHDLQDKAGIPVTYFGKPFGAVFEAIEALLPPDIPPGRIAMMGDTLHTDILGAQARGW